jgi:hypothetical protein
LSGFPSSESAITAIPPSCSGYLPVHTHYRYIGDADRVTTFRRPSYSSNGNAFDYPHPHRPDHRRNLVHLGRSHAAARYRAVDFADRRATLPHARVGEQSGHGLK